MAWLLVFHLFGVIFWMGSLLVLSSMLAKVPSEVGVAKERLIVVAEQLFNTAANAGAAVTIIFGIAMLIASPGMVKHGWLHLKLLLVAVLFGLHVWLRRRMTAIENDPNSANGREFRIFHGVLSLVLLAILILSFVQPS